MNKSGGLEVRFVQWEVAPAYDYCLNRFARVFAAADLEGAGDRFEKREAILGLRREF